MKKDCQVVSLQKKTSRIVVVEKMVTLKRVVELITMKVVFLLPSWSCFHWTMYIHPRWCLEMSLRCLYQITCPVVRYMKTWITLLSINMFIVITRRVKMLCEITFMNCVRWCRSAQLPGVNFVDHLLYHSLISHRDFHNDLPWRFDYY